MVRSLVLLFYFWSAAALSQELPLSCLPDFTSLQTLRSVGQAPIEKVFELKTLSFERLKQSGVEVVTQYDTSKKNLFLHFYFKNPEIMSLPFNLYALMVAGSKGEVVWKDFTSSCLEPGIGFYPGQKVDVALPVDLKQGDVYHLMIWGQK